ncbi:hypothetical protein MES4922_340021 [Mesorhizobium ventifaucium]|uniref:Uncharacterized protein n=1 Tax=Mesorhizobium ventifaucium TaxID=666020 RepID=A0ABN8K178_9HYPH|nr:hypothetical protein MES4922_340021 [Mesorhizobium ventifaucium]
MRMFFGFPGYSNLIKGTLVGSPSASTEAGKKHDWTAKISSNVTKKFFITPPVLLASAVQTIQNARTR